MNIICKALALLALSALLLASLSAWGAWVNGTNPVFAPWSSF